MNNNSIKISVAMATYNGERFLEKQLDSLLDQTLMPCEIIICDDCSNDNTKIILENYKNKYNKIIKIYFNESNLGYIKNFEKALSLCSGDFIALCDQDDIWDTNKIIELVESIGTNDAIHSDARLIDSSDKIIGSSFTKIARKKVFKLSFINLSITNVVTGCTLMIKKEIIDKAIPFPLFIPHDYWLALIALENKGLSYYKKPLISYRQHDSNEIGIYTPKKSFKSFLRAFKYLVKRRNATLHLLYNKSTELLKLNFLQNKTKKELLFFNEFCKMVLYPKHNIQIRPFIRSFKYFSELILIDNDYFIIPYLRILSLFYTPKKY